MRHSLLKRKGRPKSYGISCRYNLLLYAHYNMLLIIIVIIVIIVIIP